MAHYFLGNRLLGSTSRVQTWDGVQSTRSLAYFCPTCGEVWGRLVVGKGDEWVALSAPCAKHPAWRGTVQGSFLRSWNPHGLDELPDELLAYEFDTHWTHIMKEPK